MGEGMIQGSPGSSSSRLLHISMRMAGLIDLTVSSSSFSDPTVGLVQSSLAAALILCSLFATSVLGNHVREHWHLPLLLVLLEFSLEPDFFYISFWCL